jgi:hypothetical protein
MLAEKTGVHKDQIRLIFKGKPMADEKVCQPLAGWQQFCPETVRSGALTLLLASFSSRLCLINK